jgi:hypothetical protein
MKRAMRDGNEGRNTEAGKDFMTAAKRSPL